MNGYERLAIPLRQTDGTEAGLWVIEPSSSNISLDPNECSETGGELPQGWRGLPDPGDASTQLQPIQVIQRAGLTCIRLLETQSYDWEIKSVAVPEDLSVQSSLKNMRDCHWKDKRSESGSFKVVNHLGLADFTLSAPAIEPLRLHFEFVSQKFDFDSEYRQLTEDIADFCQQLLLSWDAPTSLRFTSDPEKRHKLLLEQFLFLRNFMTDERLSRLLEAITRNPHSHFNRDTAWVPSSAARSSDYLSDPCGMLRDWRTQGGRRMPGEVRDVRKENTHDTAPNRFVKFAIGHFRQICTEVCAHSETNDNQTSTLGMEASGMLEQIDAILARRFFKDVGRIQRLPLDNQTLQKREGYREVLQAWLMTQAATTLDWEGERDCYQGNTRDVATLYEYWIFIQLHKVLESMDRIEALDGNINDPARFISPKDGQLSINLRQGQHSRSRFVWRGSQTELHIDLEYERSFGNTKAATRSGSYTRRFRPDYTLSIYPASYPDEAHAEMEGKVAYLHLDAKYRAEDIVSVFGKAEVSNGEIDEETIKKIEEEISKEKLENKSERTYGRGDLLKMHTYNDALRHSIGSYVLYPGTKIDEAEKLPKFHEIAPGVGAMVMKPGNRQCLDSIRDFLKNILQHQSDLFSQYRYLSDTSYRTHDNTPRVLEEDGQTYRIARQNAPCVLLYLFKDKANVFRKHGFAYCRVDSAGASKPLNLNLSIEIGSEFIPYGGARGAPKQTIGWRGKIDSARFMQRDELVNYLRHTYPRADISPSSSEHYLLFEFSDVSSFKTLNVDSLHKARDARSKYMAITCTWREILEQAPLQDAATPIRAGN